MYSGQIAIGSVASQYSYMILFTSCGYIFSLFPDPHLPILMEVTPYRKRRREVEGLKEGVKRRKEEEQQHQSTRGKDICGCCRWCVFVVHVVVQMNRVVSHLPPTHTHTYAHTHMHTHMHAHVHVHTHTHTHYNGFRYISNHQANSVQRPGKSLY